jgi:SAM-dependent methyltransferase
MQEEINNFYKSYFRDKFVEFGDSPKGVDWKDFDAQFLSFKYIMDVIEHHFRDLESFSIFELGCGYGAFVEYLTRINKLNSVDYSGIDLVEEMILKAKATYPDIADHFFTGDFNYFDTSKQFDFIISSGVFNLKGASSDSDFERHVLQTIELMYTRSSLGTVFNVMTPAPDFKDPKLFYPSLDALFSFLYKKLSRKVIIVSSFPLWKITVGVFK